MVTNKNADGEYLAPSKDIPLSPGLGASLAERGWGTLTDNHGNILIGHELICTESGKSRVYDLTESQWKRLHEMLTPYELSADNELRTDNKIPLYDQKESPLEILHLELKSNNSRFKIIRGK